jgi:hypothetical protein
MALEQFTPRLTREQYFEGYMQYLRDEQANEAMNLGANIQYQNTGESTVDFTNMSATLGGIPRETMLATAVLKYSGYVQDVRNALMQLTPNQFQFAYVAADMIKEEIKSTYGGDLQARGGIPAQVFKAMVEGLYKGTRRSTQTGTYIPPQGGQQPPTQNPPSSSGNGIGYGIGGSRFNSARVPGSHSSQRSFR